MKNKRIYLFLKSDKKRVISDDENMTNSTYLCIPKHDTNDHIVQLDEPFLR